MLSSLISWASSWSLGCSDPLFDPISRIHTWPLAVRCNPGLLTARVKAVNCLRTLWFPCAAESSFLSKQTISGYQWANLAFFYLVENSCCWFTCINFLVPLLKEHKRDWQRFQSISEDILEKRQRFREENRAKRSYQYFDDHSMSRRLIQVPFYKLSTTT